MSVNKWFKMNKEKIIDVIIVLVIILLYIAVFMYIYTNFRERKRSELRDMGCLIIIVTHDYEQAVRISNYIYEVDEGKIIQRGT